MQMAAVGKQFRYFDTSFKVFETTSSAAHKCHRTPKRRCRSLCIRAAEKSYLSYFPARQKLPGCRRQQTLLTPHTCRASQNGSGLNANVSLVLLAGGSGKRMGAPIPKQYIELGGQPIAMYSLHVFASMPEIFEIVVVCNPEYRSLFQEYYDLLPRKPELTFAVPGIERQDSVYNGFKAVNREKAAVVAIHDSARPLITAEDTRQCLRDAYQVGAAVLGVPVKPTIKEVNGENEVVRTIQRRNLWEVQTPQAIKPGLLDAGFDLINRERLDVTDDVSIVEALGEPVFITQGSYTNIKVTTPDDLLVAEGFLRERKSAIDVAIAA